MSWCAFRLRQPHAPTESTVASVKEAPQLVAVRHSVVSQRGLQPGVKLDAPGLDEGLVQVEEGALGRQLDLEAGVPGRQQLIQEVEVAVPTLDPEVGEAFSTSVARSRPSGTCETQQHQRAPTYTHRLSPTTTSMWYRTVALGSNVLRFSSCSDALVTVANIRSPGCDASGWAVRVSPRQGWPAGCSGAHGTYRDLEHVSHVFTLCQRLPGPTAACKPESSV